MHWWRVLGLGLLGMALGAQDGPESVRAPAKRFAKRVVVSGLAGPWELTWGPDGWLWITERVGKRIVRVHPATGEKTVAVTIPEVSVTGGQEGVMGMALDPELLQGTGKDFVYAAYTYQDRTRPGDMRVGDPASPYRHLYGKIVRFRYDAAAQQLVEAKDLVVGLPAGNDHNAYRLKIGPDRKLYMTIGDQGNNQLGNFCLPVLAQRLPAAAEIRKRDYSAYEGKSLRLNLDGSIPADNPRLGGVVSHVYTVGHRNPQGIAFGPGGTLYASEHGPKTDDEINVLTKGSNYGWPHVAGLKDNKAYEYARWAEAKTPCRQLRFSDMAIHPSVPREPESAFTKPFVEPIATLFTVPTGFNFEDPRCAGGYFNCWPTVGVSSVEFYGGYAKGIPGWDNVLLISTLKRGSIYVLPLTADGKKAAGKMSRYLRAENRYRDTAISPDGLTIYAATDAGGLVESLAGEVASQMQDAGAILAFAYEGEGAPASEPAVTGSAASSSAKPRGSGGPPPRFTAQQAADGKKAYEGYCAVCHGSTLANGTFGTPLAGSYFRSKWSGQTVHAFIEKTKTMPPAAPKSLPDKVYTDAAAYILEFNGAKAGSEALPAGGGALMDMWIQ